MIITRAPLRISLSGGGTDLPHYYRKYNGFAIAAAIDKYVYISLHETFKPGIILKYSQMEKVDCIEDVQHPIIRAALQMVDVHDPHLEICSFADIPAGTGLGSSSSFTVALLKALYTYQHYHIYPDELAQRACEIEIDRLHEPVGKQDQHISATGGLLGFHFNDDDTVALDALSGINTNTISALEDNLLLFYTGQTRSASSVLSSQTSDNLQDVHRLAGNIRQALEHNRLNEFATLMSEGWKLKKQRSSTSSNLQIDEWYELGMNNGALGGKLVGAGGGGFLMFYVEDKARLRAAMSGANLREVRFSFDWNGAQVVSR